MLVYRVFGYDPNADPGESGSATYIYPKQTTGRWDNFPDYTIIYVAYSPEGAIGETFGRHPVWGDAIFEAPFLPGNRYALATFSMDDDTPLVDLDDASVLVDRGLRPTQVISRNVPFTQGLALKIFRERSHDGTRKWAGIRWWSAWKPIWRVAAIWTDPGDPLPLKLKSVEPLDLNHHAVLEAATSLVRSVAP